jgi:hypothetical protein
VLSARRRFTLSARSQNTATHRAPQYARVRRGFRAFLAGIRERNLDERLHQFVRALDGILRLPANGGQPQFVHRCRLFTEFYGQSAVLREMYRFRNTFEHLNDWRGAAGQAPVVPDERTAALRAYQAEILARRVFQRLFSNPDILRRFETDEDIDGFWAAQGSHQRVVWGPSFNLEEASRGFRWRLAPDE